MGQPPSQTQQKFIVRLPDGMRERIRTAAEANNRSMNAEIIHALEFYYGFDGLRPDWLNHDGPHTEHEQQAIDAIQDDAETITSALRAARRLLYRLESAGLLAQKVSREKGS